MALLIYVRDLVLTGDDKDTYVEFKKYLNSCFYIKDLGSIIYFLGIEVANNSQGLFLSQRKYVLEIVDEYGLLEVKPVDFPIETNHKLALATNKDDSGS